MYNKKLKEKTNKENKLFRKWRKTKTTQCLCMAWPADPN